VKIISLSCCVEFLVKVDESDEAEERRWGALYLMTRWILILLDAAAL
jgi:hypothetical protein